MTQFIQKLLLQHCKQQISSNSKLSSNSQPNLGFTLTELLVVVLTASLVVTTLMSLVVQLMSTEQREAARTETQRETQLAINYIASDLRQAVYIYDNSEHPHPNSTSQPSYLESLPAVLQNGNNYRPVLAFWKTKPIENIEAVMGNLTYNPDGTSSDGCQSFKPDVAEVAECNNLWLKRQTYSLVAYFQTENYTDNDLDNPSNTNANGKWRGKSRIVRYELDKYSDVSQLERTDGYVDPSETSTTEGFVSWPFEGSSTNADNCQTSDCGLVGGVPGPPGGSPVTLVDFIDFTDHFPANGRDLASRNDEPDNCDSLNTTPGEYFMMPEASTDSPKPAFFVCIRDTRTPPAIGSTVRVPRVGEVQDIVVFLRGNAQGRSVSSDSFLPTLQTRITMRGVIDRVIR